MQYKVPVFDVTKEFTDLQWFQFYDKYSKYQWSLGRRETWVETVTRTVDFLVELSDNLLSKELYQEIFDGIYKMEVAPSMRLFSNAGESARRNHEMIYNCSFLPIDDIAAFGEVLWLSMCGVGVGYSVEKQNIELLPIIERSKELSQLFVVPDTSEGWKQSVDICVKNAFHGVRTFFDYSNIRKAGAPLKTKGGTASGPEILQEIHEFIRLKFSIAEGRKLNSLEVHDIICKIADAGISGGVRRAALIALFDFDDYKMRHCKDGEYYKTNPQRMNANNSAVWPENLSKEEVVIATKNLFETGSGEPGIFNRNVCLNSSPSWRKFKFASKVGVNPCSEVFLEPYQFCNLSSVICRENDTLESLEHKTRIATIIGDIQSLATNFKQLRPIWKEITDKDRLLGVNHIGHANCPELRKVETQLRLKEVAEETDLMFSEIFEVNRSAAILSVKPSGNSSLLFNVGPGINPEHERFSLRNVTVNRTTAMFNFLFANGVPNFAYEGAKERILFSFPQKKENVIVLDDVSALDQLDYWRQVKTNMLHHTASCSIVYEPHEVDGIVNWIYQNQNIISGLSFFPKFDNSHPHLPIQKVSKDYYEEAMNNFPSLNWNNFFFYENTQDEQNQVAECVGGNCAIA